MKLTKKVIAIIMAVMMMLPFVGLFCFAADETTTAVEEPTTSLLDNIEDKLENTELGIDGFAATEMFGKIISWFMNLVDNIRAFIENLDLSKLTPILDKVTG